MLTSVLLLGIIAQTQAKPEALSPWSFQGVSMSLPKRDWTDTRLESNNPVGILRKAKDLQLTLTLTQNPPGVLRNFEFSVGAIAERMIEKSKATVEKKFVGMSGLQACWLSRSDKPNSQTLYIQAADRHWKIEFVATATKDAALIQRIMKTVSVKLPPPAGWKTGSLPNSLISVSLPAVPQIQSDQDARLGTSTAFSLGLPSGATLVLTELRYIPGRAPSLGLRIKNLEADLGFELSATGYRKEVFPFTSGSLSGARVDFSATAGEKQGDFSVWLAVRENYAWTWLFARRKDDAEAALINDMILNSIRIGN